MNKATPEDSKRKKIFSYILIIIPSLILIFFIFAFFASGRSGSQTASTISSSIKEMSYLDSHYKTIYFPTYSFDVAGETYFCDSPSSTIRPKQESTIFYNPNNPSDCSVEKIITLNSFWVFAFLFPPLLIIIGILTLVKINKHAKKDNSCN